MPFLFRRKHISRNTVDLPRPAHPSLIKVVQGQHSQWLPHDVQTQLLLNNQQWLASSTADGERALSLQDILLGLCRPSKGGAWVLLLMGA